MHIIKLDAIDSTNSYLRALSMEETLEDYTVVLARNQTNGRGQMGAVWEVESSKSLTFSVFKDVSKIKVEAPFFISIATSLALFKTLRSFSIPKLSIKWPNDILSENKKICGILIENVIKKNSVQASIIGIGLNVNQTSFKNLPMASSLKSVTGVNYSLDEVLLAVLSNLKNEMLNLRNADYAILKRDYESHLFRKNKPSTFRDAEGTLFSGIIKGVSDSGKLNVLIEDAIVNEFDLKEITLLY
jgi:BirA family biotin operon repressor/biotin-[acetyl-CoA-carboxylase] ligase